MNNTYGQLFRITTAGESHGKGLGVIIDGVPAGIKIDYDFIQNELTRRKPGQSKITTQRKEADEVQILSGVFIDEKTGTDKTTGTPIQMVIFNQDQKSKDYSHIAEKFRPSHADYTYHVKYDGYRDYRGGGRSSARETAARVAAGAIAKLALNQLNIDIKAYVSQAGSIKLDKPYTELDLSKIEDNIIRCPEPEIAEEMITMIDQTRKNRDTIGGVVSCVITGCPAGLGEPAFDKLHAELGKAMLSINAVKGFEYGSGFDGVAMYGSEHNDEFYTDENGNVRTKTNHSGGIQGGISNGQDIYFKTAFKPVATIMSDQESIDINGDKVVVAGKGRHDPCVVSRAVPIVEAMAAIVILDFYLRNKAVTL
ncbi:MAG: chorismate synthase [Cytophagales bacterium]|nr:chorismate synthase [Cytophagales bacterium]